MNKSFKIIVIACSGVIALLFVKLMFDMSSNMAAMTGHVGSLATDVSQMSANMQAMADDMAQMRESMERMDANIQGMGSAVKQGGKVFQQWDPTRMLQ